MEEEIMERTWNAPVLGEGMYAVNFTGKYPISDENYGWERTTVSEWDYIYEKGKRKWANAETEDGSLYVWIPRYTYKHNNDSYSIKFSNGIIDDTSGGFKPHPAFTFGDKELTGFWVTKFAAAKEDESEDYEYICPVSKPFKQVLLYGKDTLYEFMRAYKLNRTLDSHMMTYAEHNAVKILSICIGWGIYGIEICATGVCEIDDWHRRWKYEYGSESYYPNNTMNIYGIFDYDVIFFESDFENILKRTVERKYRGVPRLSCEPYHITLAIPPKS